MSARTRIPDRIRGVIASREQASVVRTRVPSVPREPQRREREAIEADTDTPRVRGDPAFLDGTRQRRGPRRTGARERAGTMTRDREGVIPERTRRERR